MTRLWYRTIAITVALLPLSGCGRLGNVGSEATQVNPLSNCLWVGPVAAGYENAGYLDEAGVYWYSEYQLPPGATLVLRGRFPRARYMSLNSYDANGRPTAAINDVGTAPDAGASNPYRDGADRTVRNRSFTMDVVDQPPPAVRRPNTLYAGVPGQSTQKMLYRIFVSDRGTDLTGDGGLPEHELRLADATSLTGQPACDAMKANPKREVPMLRLMLPVERYRAMRAPVPGLPDTHPAFDPPDWEAYFGQPYGISRYLKGTPREAERAKVTTTKAGGFYSGQDVDYISAFVDRKFGSVLVLRGKAPTTPRTHGGALRMESGQMRYWSICQNESAVTTRYVACLYDEQVPLDRDGYYTIAVSSEQERPANAHAGCGVAWLNWGTRGDGVDRPTAGSLLMRHLLPSPSFPQTFRNVVTPGTEARVLGPYLPAGSYMSREQFEAKGCQTP